MRVAVTSRSFSNNLYLRNYLSKKFKNCIFNETNKTISKKKDLIAFLKNIDVAIVGLDFIDKSILSSLPKLKIISKYGVGLNNLDLKEMKKRKISLGYSDGVNKNSVAELTLSAAILLRHNALKALSLVRDNSWKQIVGKELKGCKFGIIGYGNVGHVLARYLKAFKCKTYYYDTNKSIIEKTNLALPLPINTLINECDIISLHIPLNKKNVNFFDKKKIIKMKQDSIFLNFSRGGLVDEKFIIKHYKSGYISGLGFDVLKDEPKINFDFDKQNIFISPHIGGSSEESIKSMGETAVNNIKKAKIPSINFIKYYSLT